MLGDSSCVDFMYAVSTRLRKNIFLSTFLIDDCSDRPILQTGSDTVTFGATYDETKSDGVSCAQSHRDVKGIYAFLCGKSIDAVPSLLKANK